MEGIVQNYNVLFKEDYEGKIKNPHNNAPASCRKPSQIEHISFRNVSATSERVHNDVWNLTH